MSTYQELVDRYFPHDEETAEFEGGVPEATIAAAEAKLGVRFPAPLRAFLGELGSGSAGSEEIIGLGGPPHLDIVRATVDFKARPGGAPDGLLPLRRDGFGNLDCLDVSTGGVVEWVHTAPFAERRVLAPDYEEWFESILELATDDEN
jgi:hypothetical protein